VSLGIRHRYHWRTGVQMNKMIARVDAGLTGRRVCAHGLILLFALWSVYAWDMAGHGLIGRSGNLKGTDFLHFYTLGSLALAHRGVDLYNMEAQRRLSAERVPVAAGIRYLPLYPPQVSILFAPFARLSYSWALILWLALSSLLYGLCCYGVWRACDNLRNRGPTVLVLALAYPAFWHLIAWGQTSSLALVCFTLAFFALRAQWEFAAGLAFGCLMFKPQLGLAAAVVFAVSLNWRVIAGALISASAELAAAWVYYGVGPLREWMRTLLHLPAILPLLEPRPYQTHSLRSFWTIIVPWPDMAILLYIISALAAIALALGCWRSRLALPLRYSALLLATALVAPHLTVYDLVILAPAFLLLSDWCIEHSAETASTLLKPLLYLAYSLPLIGPLARWTHVQLSVLVMVAVLLVLYELGKKSRLANLFNAKTA
jgi:hypothetical protein